MKMKLIDKTTIKFVIVGIINTIVGTGVMFVLYNVFKASYWFSSAMNYIVGSIVSYFLNKYYTFQYKESSFKQILKFILNISICYFIAYGTAKPLVYKVLQGFNGTIRDNVAMLMGMGIFVVLNYIGQRFFVFRKKEENT